MKTIKTLVEIPARFKWMAQDKCGDWCAYTKKPELDRGYNMWSISNDGEEFFNLGEGNPNPNWKDTLQRIHEYEEIEP